MKKAVLTFLLVLVIFLSGCNGQTSSNDNVIANEKPTNSAAENVDTGVQVTVEIKDFAFVPQDVTINKGDTIIWKNMDSAPHTVVSTSGSDINSGSLSMGEMYLRNFKTTGTYEYHCSIHPSMKGTVIVK
jgi:plastocyanin